MGPLLLLIYEIILPQNVGSIREVFTCLRYDTLLTVFGRNGTDLADSAALVMFMEENWFCVNNVWLNVPKYK